MNIHPLSQRCVHHGYVTSDIRKVRLITRSDTSLGNKKIFWKRGNVWIGSINWILQIKDIDICVWTTTFSSQNKSFESEGWAEFIRFFLFRYVDLKSELIFLFPWLFRWASLRFKLLPGGCYCCCCCCEVVNCSCLFSELMRQTH